MPNLRCDLDELLAAWSAEAGTFDACDMPASALALRECHRRLSALLSAHPEQADAADGVSIPVSPQASPDTPEYGNQIRAACPPAGVHTVFATTQPPAA